jgi:hypothetical protein
VLKAERGRYGDRDALTGMSVPDAHAIARRGFAGFWSFHVQRATVKRVSFVSIW